MGNDVANSFHGVDFQAPDCAYVPMDNRWLKKGP
jgi:hypothetical protein